MKTQTHPLRWRGVFAWVFLRIDRVFLRISLLTSPIRRVYLILGFTINDYMWCPEQIGC
jgi:hypothetical protein